RRRHTRFDCDWSSDVCSSDLLVLSGHLHSGQITIPYGIGKLRLAHLRPGYFEGLYVRPAATLHVSPGLGTTFVPFRFAARPEAKIGRASCRERVEMAVDVGVD